MSSASYDAIVTPVRIVRGDGAGAAIRGWASGRAAEGRGDALADRSAPVVPKTYELTEFLVDVLGVTDVGAYYPHTVTYHPTCHGLRDARPRRPAAAAAPGGQGAGAARAAGRRGVLRLRRHLRA